MQLTFTSPLHSVANKASVVTIAYVLLAIMLAITMVMSKHTTRVLHATIQSLQAQAEDLNNEWNQLQLEHATWTSGIRVEKVASEQLQMIIPTKVELIKP